MMNELIFMYLDCRCHAQIVDEISVEKIPRNYIGSLDGYEIYKTYGSLFDQFGFEAIKERK